MPAVTKTIVGGKVYTSDPSKVSVTKLTAAAGTKSATDTVADVGAAFSQTTLNNDNATLTAKVNNIVDALKSRNIAF